MAPSSVRTRGYSPLMAFCEGFDQIDPVACGHRAGSGCPDSKGGVGAGIGGFDGVAGAALQAY